MNNKQLPVALSPLERVWGIRYLLFQYIFLPSLLSWGRLLLFPTLSNVYLDFAYFAINFCAVIGIFRRYLMASVQYTARNLSSCALAAGCGFALYQVLMYAIAIWIRVLYPDFFNVNDANIAVTAKENPALMAIGTVVLVPIVEEVLYRGIVFGLLCNKNKVLGYTVSTLVFCAIHVAGYWGYYEPQHLLICFIQYIPAGLVLAGAYAYSGSIFAPILIHMAVNAIGIFSAR